MKKALLIAVATILVVSVVNGALAAGCICLYTGPDSNSPAQTYPSGHINLMRGTSGTYTETYIWTWCWPSNNGLRGAEFMLVPPDEDVTDVRFSSTHTYQNPLISVTLGDIWMGIDVTYSSCQTTWAWTHYMRCRLYDDVPSVLMIVANPSSGKLQFASCLTGYPKEDIGRVHFYFNRETDATEDATWGAIKSLF